MTRPRYSQARGWGHAGKTGKKRGKKRKNMEASEAAHQKCEKGVAGKRRLEKKKKGRGMKNRTALPNKKGLHRRAGNIVGAECLLGTKK